MHCCFVLIVKFSVNEIFQLRCQQVANKFKLYIITKYFTSIQYMNEKYITDIARNREGELQEMRICKEYCRQYIIYNFENNS